MWLKIPKKIYVNKSNIDVGAGRGEHMGKEPIKTVFISCIVVTYQAADVLEQALLSLIGQTYKPEIIVVDGGSEDGTKELLERYKKDIDTIISEPDNGIYDAMNKGVKYANGEYVYFLGADDCLLRPDTIERVIKSLNSTRPDVLYGPVMIVKEDTHLEKISFTEAGDAAFQKNNHLAHQGMFCRRMLLLEHPFELKYRICADHEFVLWLFYKYHAKFVEFNEPVAYYSDGGTSSQCMLELRKESMEIMKQYNFPSRVIDNYQNKIKRSRFRALLRSWKSFIKLIAKRMGILNMLSIHQGWAPHHCNWKDCRWQ